ncbi:GNAT family N-acetyltransferase [Candidatus Beckwithbacteria bacterium]|nr:GNAT family N-acetyltransferase [Candidatus Beckwithbacteria bacterium]
MINYNFNKTITLKTGQQVTLRYPQQNDIDEVLNYINKLVEEDVFILLNEKKTKEEEVKFIQNATQEINDQKGLVIFAFAGEKLVGITNIGKGRFREENNGELGISLAKEFRGLGLGRILINEIIAQAKQYLNINLLILAVCAPNQVALNLYQSVGFHEYGRLPQAVKYKDQMIDKILMYKNL